MNSKEEVLVFLRSINTDRLADLRAYVARNEVDGELERETWEHLRDITHHVARLDSLRDYFGVGKLLRKKRVLVTGGHMYSNKQRVWGTLDDICDSWGDLFIIQGGATRGADQFAREWATGRSLPYATVPAQRKRGNLMVKESNGWMVEMEPDLCVSFPGSTGTSNCVKQAKAAFVPHYEVGER